MAMCKSRWKKPMAGLEVMSYKYPSIGLLNPEQPVQQGEKNQNSEVIYRNFGGFRFKIDIKPLTPVEPELQEELKQTSEILAPIPGTNSVGIEVPNKEWGVVPLLEILDSSEWRDSKAQMPIVLGKDMNNKPVVTDLAKIQHLLIGGSTGSGKSVCIHTIIASLLYRFSPNQLRFIMIDPKKVELQQYNVLPHIIVPVVTEPQKAVLALKWLLEEIWMRYGMFARKTVENIEEFNSCSTYENKLFHIVLVIDELNDLMCVAGREVERYIQRITQMAPIAGVHCIIATQRPSVNVMTDAVKANIPARIAFQVSNRQDSNVILDSTGAEKLLGNGDMLFLSLGKPKKRLQGAYVGDDEINRILDYIKAQAQPDFSEELMRRMDRPLSEIDEEDEELIQKCIGVIYAMNRASVPVLQRTLRLGYNRAVRIMNILKRRGIVCPCRERACS